MIKKTILSVLSAATVICTANAAQAPAKAADAPAQLAVEKNCPTYVLIPGYVYEWRVDENGCRYPVLISRG